MFFGGGGGTSLKSFMGQGDGTVRFMLEIFQVKIIPVAVLGSGFQNVFYSIACKQCYHAWQSPGGFVTLHLNSSSVA